jgi:hypothetical protein
LLLFTWFGWSLAEYGARGTLASNTSITDLTKDRENDPERISGHLIDTLVPYILRDFDGARKSSAQPSLAGFIRDSTFVVYQANLIFGMGVVGGPVVVWLWLGRLRRKSGGGAQRAFWLLLVPCVVMLGVAVVGERDENGSAHLTLLPMMIMGLAFLAANFCRRRWVAYLVLAGALVDFPVGVMLQARVENLENRPGHTVFTGLSFENGGFAVGTPGPESLSRAAWFNWIEKHQYAMAQEWLGEVDRYHGEGPRFAQSRASLRAGLQKMIGEDQTMWQGWSSSWGIPSAKAGPRVSRCRRYGWRCSGRCGVTCRPPRFPWASQRPPPRARAKRGGRTWGGNADVSRSGLYRNLSSSAAPGWQAIRRAAESRPMAISR